MSRLAATFAQLNAQKRAAFIPFLVAGYPDIKTSADLVKASAQAGADIIEIGVPFSDPIADGPVIQAAFSRALDKGFRVAQVFEMVRALRNDGIKTPLVFMISYTLVFKRSLDGFLQECQRCGVDGLIMPDLPAGYEGDAAERCAAAGIDLIFLVAPTTPPERCKLIAQRSRGFIYYISITGITGARTALPADLAQRVASVRALTRTPVCVGFGISQPEQAAAVRAAGDGVIVGSALVKKVDEALAQNLSGAALVKHVVSLVENLAKACH
ncbi:MAG TPA: tryptophan synthase subunit alpha [Planctomycetota bacterium]|jgi:tryptophan synthase alpha chain